MLFVRGTASNARGGVRGRAAGTRRSSQRSPVVVAGAKRSPQYAAAPVPEAAASEGSLQAGGKRDRPASTSSVRSRDRSTVAMVGQGTNHEVAKSWDKILRWGRINMLRKASDGGGALERCKKVAVLGGGSFGTAVATLLANNKPEGLEVVILMRDEEQARSITEDHCNSRYLPTHVLPKSVRATTVAADALEGAEYIVHAIPVQSSRKFLSRISDLIPPSVPILSLSKGLEIGSNQTMAELIVEALGREQPLAVLSGPTFAVELMAGLPTAIVAASTEPGLTEKVQQLLASEVLRVNTSNDVVGVEIAGALKNVLAIAAGAVVGLDLGNNALAAVVAQGVAEIRWLACKMGAKQATMTGLSGVGDIMLTCFVDLSRNRTVGKRLGRGESIEEILASSSQVAEGVATASSVVELADRYHVALPVLTAVAKIVDGQLTPREALELIMGLPQVAEV
mmetsp:Transcript_8270/g.29027  ORF Transcript_8270/g.29027 Transcript_8270/m.29027 type:complete len:454 (+) Transcript_8270:229-1590(+)